MVVIGDSDFAANCALGIQGNRDLFLNIVNWLAQQENLISIRPKDPDDRRLTLTRGQQKAVKWLALLILPARDLRGGRVQLGAEAQDEGLALARCVLGVAARRPRRLSLLRRLRRSRSSEATTRKPRSSPARGRQDRGAQDSTSPAAWPSCKKSADGWKLTGPTPARPTTRRSRRHHQQPRVGDDASASSTRAPANLGDYGLKEPVVEVSFKAKGAKEFRTLQIGTKTPTGSDMYAKRRWRQEGLSRSRLSGVDVQPHAVRSARQEDHELRSREGRSHRDRAWHVHAWRSPRRRRVAR